MLKEESQRLLHYLCNCTTCVPAYCLNTLGIKNRFNLIRAFITVADISFLSKEETWVINFLHLQGDRARIHSSDSRGNLTPNLERLFDSASSKEDKHTAENTVTISFFNYSPATLLIITQ